MTDKIDFSGLKPECCDFCENCKVGQCPKVNPRTMEELYSGIKEARDGRIVGCDCFVLRFRKVLLFLMRVLFILFLIRVWVCVYVIITLGPSPWDVIPLAVFTILAVAAYGIIKWLEAMKGAVAKSEELNRLHMQEALPPKKPTQRRKAGAATGTAKKEEKGQPNSQKRGA